MPASCHTCGLTLVASPHLARSYHHLFPVAPFKEVPPGELPALQVRQGIGYKPIPYTIYPSRRCHPGS